MTDRIKLRELSDAATAGPWVEDDGHIHSKPLCDLSHKWVMQRMDGKEPDFDRPKTWVATCDQELPNFQADADFIAATREAVPTLLDELDYVEEKCKKLEEENKRLQPDCPCPNCAWLAIQVRDLTRELEELKKTLPPAS